ncbi:MAG: C39 family peptidase [Candidatus Omnitrophota bacterium]
MKDKAAITPLLFLILIISLIFYTPCAAASIGLNFGAGRITKEVKSLQDIKTQNIITQSWDYSCGPASIATILTHHFDDKITEQQVISYLLLTTDLEKVKARRGFSLLDLKNFALAKGYNAAGYKMDLSSLVEMNVPVLIPIKIKDYNHFVIFRGLRRDRVFLADPVLGHMTMRVEKFLSIWKGGVGFVVTKEGIEPVDSRLALTKEEESLLTDHSYVQRILGENSLGRVFASGEF